MFCGFRGHPEKLAVCSPLQLQHVGGTLRGLEHLEVGWSPAHLTHTGSLVHWKEE